MQSLETDNKSELAQEILNNQITLWFVWSRTEEDLVSLRAVCTKHRYANLYMKILEKSPGITKAWMEAQVGNYLYEKPGYVSFKETK